ncbi:histidine kinase [Duganella sp. Leaf126]|uniref:CHASE domain-containing protein n=1 Tax=Duganella sp. Leaf126 TaxID=1736266 RepID=UPI0006FAD6A5|nr:CHASE domain-containing protein [Duganella sp. Leaf126]KQQ32456.1 histidine kinase [Duganella sp. Leaf126]
MPAVPPPVTARTAPTTAATAATPVNTEDDPLPPQAPARDHHPGVATLLLLTVGYAVAAALSMQVGFAHTNATPLWPQSGIALAAVILLGRRAWPAIMLGAFVANLATFLFNGQLPTATVVLVSAVIGAGNVCEALAGAWMMRRLTDGAQPLGQLQNVYKFALIAMVMSLVGAGIGGGALTLSGLAPDGATGTILLTWWVGDTAGALLMAPAIVIWRLRPPVVWRESGARRWTFWLEVAASLALLAALSAAIFLRNYASDEAPGWLPYLFVPCVAWAAHRYGLRGATAVCLLAAGAAVAATVNGQGPFVAGTMNDALIALDTFVVLCSLIGMVLSADAAERRRLQAGLLQHSAAQWATLLLGVGLTVLVWQLVAAGTERRAREHFEAASHDIAERIERRISLYESGLRAAQALFQAVPQPSREQWRSFAAGMDLQRHVPGVMGLGYAAVVRKDQRAALEAQAARDGYPDFRSWTRAGASDIGLYAPVYYLEPFSGRNLMAFGYDMLSEPVRRIAMLKAARSGQPALTERVVLVQDAQGGGQPGFLMYSPIYRRHPTMPADATPAQRMAALQGFAYSPIRAADLMDGLTGSGMHDLRIEIFDGDGTDAGKRLFASTADRTAADQLQYPNPYQGVHPLELLQHRWTLRFTSLPDFERSIDRQKSHIVLLAGMIISLLFFGVVRALTARRLYATGLARQMTAALRESQQSLIVARDQAEAASRAKTEFVANMSHEIRTPLNAVLGMAHLLDQTALAPAQRQYVGMIRSSGGSLLTILNDVLDFSKIEAGRMELAPAPFALAQVLEAVATIMSVNAGEKNLHLAIGVDAGVPARLVGDSHRLQQVLVNLVGNAIKFTERGSVTLLVEGVAQAHTPAGSAVPEVTLRFTVRDTGIGIGPDRLAQLFAPFAQADASMTRRFGGTGLGLTISRRLADLMGGAVTVRSTPGVGSDFVLTVPLPVPAPGQEMGDDAGETPPPRTGNTLPAAPLPVPVPPTAGEAGSTQAPGTGEPVPATPVPVMADEAGARRSHGAGDAIDLLLIGDQGPDARFLPRTVVSCGWRAALADSGDQALRMLGDPARRIDAVLLDWNMPAPGGRAVLAALRADARRAARPVLVMVNAFEQGSLLLADGDHGADGVLLKPVTAARLREAMKTALRRGPAPATVPPKQVAPPAMAGTGNQATHENTLDAAQDGNQVPGREALQAAPPVRLDGAHLLLVEDNPINQLVARSMLEHAGARVTAADHGRAALDMLRAGADDYDLVLMDVQMPEMDGFTATGLIRTELGLTLPVLAMTAGVMASEREQCIASGMDDFIAKPIDVEQMLAAIQSHLQHPRQRQRHRHTAARPG